MIKVVDNFLDEKSFKRLKDLMSSPFFPWFYQDYVAAEELKDNLYYFAHSFYINETSLLVSDFFKEVYPILEKIQPKDIIRVKGNLYPQSSQPVNDPYHVDYTFAHRGAIYYLNTNNGPTIFKDGTKVEAVENRIMFFDPTIEHASVRCTDAKIRLNINFNYYE